MGPKHSRQHRNKMDYSSLIEFDKKNDRKKKDTKKDTAKKDTSKRTETRRRSRSRSPPQIVEPIEEEVVNYNLPNRQFGDLYCVVCDSHMNSEQMWENHVTGKRHLKNSRKGETVEQKYEYSNEESTIQKELDNMSPIAGLDHICEIVRINQPPIYQCFLCSASLTTSKLLIEHITGLKHQMAFLKEHDKEKFSYIEQTNLTKTYIEPIIKDLMSKYEEEHGRGRMSVKKEKGKPGSSFSYKRSNKDDGDRRPHPKSTKQSSKSSKYTPASTSRYSPQPSSSRHSPQPSTSRYSPQPSSSRYSPPTKSSKYSPPSTSSRYSPAPTTSRYSPYSPPPKSARMRERSPETEWQKVPPVKERSRERRYSERSHYSDEEKWQSMPLESTAYRRAAPTCTETHDSRFDRAINYGQSWASPDEGKSCSDLRLILEQKKSLGMTLSAAKANVDLSPSVPVSSEISSISNKLLGLVNDMSPGVFLSLAVFKLDSMNVTEEELKLLDSVAELASALARNVRKKSVVPGLKAKFQEALAQNGLSSQGNSVAETSSQNNLQFTQNLENFIGHFKSRKTTVYDDVNSQGAFSTQLKSSQQFLDNKPTSHHQLNAPSLSRNAPETATTYNSGWNQRQSTALPFQSFSSTPSYIPGLEMVSDTPEESPSQASSVLSQFAQAVKPIFGNINVPSTPPTPFSNEDYNRLNYRY